MNAIGNTQTDEILRAQVVATYASAIIANMGRPVSMEDVLKVRNDVHLSLFPQTGSGRQEAWKTTHDPKKLYD